MKVKFKLVKFENQILFQIIEQNDIPSNSRVDIETKNGISLMVRRCSMPELVFEDYENVIYLRGDDESASHNISIFDIENSSTSHTINEIYDAILDAIEKASRIDKHQWIRD